MEIETATESVVSLTQNAAQEVKSMLEKPENAGKTLRVYVEQGGCSGMQYSMIFDEQRPDDLAGHMHGVSVLVDPFSAQYLRGTVHAATPGRTTTGNGHTPVSGTVQIQVGPGRQAGDGLPPPGPGGSPSSLQLLA